MISSLSDPPNNWDEATIRHKVLAKYGADQFQGTAFDPDWVMRYFFPGSWVKSGAGTHENDVLSSVDKGYVATTGFGRPATSSVEPRTHAVPQTRLLQMQHMKQAQHDSTP